MSTNTTTSAVSTHTRPITVTSQSIVGIAVLGLATFFAITTELMPVGLLGTMSSDLGVSESTISWRIHTIRRHVGKREARISESV